MNLLIPERTVTGRDWRETVKAQQHPLDTWKSDFNAWREYFSEFRKFEKEVFFAKTSDLLTLRIHRGWVCDLISSGERLASDLMISNAGGEHERDGQLRIIDSFLNNIRATYETWHSLENPAGQVNPLAEYFK